ncbi:MAG: FAD-dependent thymidylate synthase [Dehalococcoidia bacterium]|nr:FAD-dependent thymidylate synthase [Dehalococcoidia bacterium]
MTNEYDIEVKLLAVTPEAERLVETAGRLCWDTQDKTGTMPDRIQKWLEVGHESMIEHAYATFYIRASRVLTHELVRHRLASYSQRSQRYVKENEPRYVEPPEIKEEGELAHQQFEEVMKSCWEAYRGLLAKGIKPEIARYVLPNACESQIICTWNFREIRHIIKLRSSKRALPEFRAVANEIRRIAKEIAPQAFEDL